MTSSEKLNRVILVGILISLLFIASKPEVTYNPPNIDIPMPSSPEVAADHSAVQLDKNRFAVIKGKGDEMDVLVFEYNEKTQKLTQVTKSTFNPELDFIIK